MNPFSPAMFVVIICAIIYVCIFSSITLLIMKLLSKQYKSSYYLKKYVDGMFLQGIKLRIFGGISFKNNFFDLSAESEVKSRLGYASTFFILSLAPLDILYNIINSKIYLLLMIVVVSIDLFIDIYIILRFIVGLRKNELKL